MWDKTRHRTICGCQPLNFGRAARGDEIEKEYLSKGMRGTRLCVYACMHAHVRVGVGAGMCTCRVHVSGADQGICRESSLAQRPETCARISNMSTTATPTDVRAPTRRAALRLDGGTDHAAQQAPAGTGNRPSSSSIRPLCTEWSHLDAAHDVSSPLLQLDAESLALQCLMGPGPHAGARVHPQGCAHRGVTNE